MLVYQFKNKEPYQNNIGDNLSGTIIKSFSKKEEIKVTNSQFIDGKILAIGSIMPAALNNDIVWGSGMLYHNQIPTGKPKILAVRGPLTRNELLKNNFKCKEVYGDPALLLPKLWNKNREIKHEYGIIPHYVDHDSPLLNVFKNNNRFKIIDICNPNLIDFLNELLSVKKILSSSLHGLILADAYGIPNSRINITNGLVGGHFKFIDYYMSVHRYFDFGYQLQDNRIDFLDRLHFNDKINIDIDLLLENSPWTQ